MVELPQQEYIRKSDSARYNSLKCQECGSQRIWKDGKRYNASREIQRYLCRECGYRFSEPNVKVNIPFQGFKGLNPGTNLPYSDVAKGELPIKEGLNSPSFQGCKDIASHSVSIVEKDINNFRVYNSDCQVCVSEQEAKNLSQQPTRQKQAAGATKHDEAMIKGKIVELAWQLKKNGYSKHTIQNYTRFLFTLMKLRANLYDPEDVKEVIARQEAWSESTKFIYVASYSAFAQANNIHWKPPKYRIRQKLPFIPLEQEIDVLIAGCGKKTSTILQLLKETGIRIGEALKLEWTDVDLEKNRIAVNSPEKGSNARIFKVSNKLASMINALPKDTDKVFNETKRGSASRNFHYQRKRMAKKLQNPRLLRITFHTLRHWKATMEYHKTKDILHVMQMLGHRNIRNTLIYTQLVDVKSDEYHSATAKTAEKASKLVEAGFEYV